MESLKTQGISLPRLGLGTFRMQGDACRAAVESAYYQVLLDQALIDVEGQNIENLHQILKVTEIAYQGQQAAQTDFITADWLAMAPQRK